MAKTKVKKKRGIQGYAIVTIWYNDNQTSPIYLGFVEYHQTTKQQAQETFEQAFKLPRYTVVDVRVKQPITIFI